MGYRTRRKSEYLIVLQKSPIRAKGCWNIHTIPDVWEENIVSDVADAAGRCDKLQKQLILATTNENDWVLDPASGGYSVFNACVQTNRNFIGGDILYGEN